MVTVCPAFNCVGVQLRYFTFQRSDPPFEAKPIAPSLCLSAQSRYENCGCASEQHCKNTHLDPPVWHPIDRAGLVSQLSMGPVNGQVANYV
jgi:hypothetical protein